MTTTHSSPSPARDEAWEEEKRIWGWLGRPPKEVLEFRETSSRWLALSKEAKRVVGMRKGEARTEAAKKVESERNAIIAEAMARSQARELSNANF